MTKESAKRVFIARFENPNEIERKVREGLVWIRGWDIIDHNARVFLKPNLTWSSYTPGVTASPVVLEAVISLLRNCTSYIIIGESDGGYHSFKAEEAFEKHGIYDIADRYGARVVNLCTTRAEIVRVRIGSKIVSVKLPSVLLHDVDVFITIPVPKVHAMTGVSLGFKNQWGCIPDAMRLRYHPKFNETILAINKILNPQIVICDGTYFLDKNGPMAGEAVRMNLLMIANDLGAGDFVCSQLMGIDPFKISHFRAARKAGMFPSSLAEIALNTDFRHFAKRKFILKRNFLNWIALLAFNSHLLTTVLYDSEIGVLLHKALYALRRSHIIKNVLYGRFEPPDEQGGSR